MSYQSNWNLEEAPILEVGGRLYQPEAYFGHEGQRQSLNLQNNNTDIAHQQSTGQSKLKTVVTNTNLPTSTSDTGLVPAAERESLLSNGHLNLSALVNLQTQQEDQIPVTKSRGSKKESPIRFIKRFWRSGWWAEILSCLLALISFAGLVITLKLHNEKPLPQWPFSITINGMVAVLTALLKAGLSLPLSEGVSQLKWQLFHMRARKISHLEVYDSAARGFWGSFWFLFKGDGEEEVKSSSNRLLSRIFSFIVPKRRNIRNYIAKLGAICIILAFIADPFTQQLVQYNPCGQISSEIATGTSTSISRTTIYNATGGHAGFGALNQLDAPMQIAIDTGVTNPPTNVSTLVDANCSTGNCTYPIFETLGICQTCSDISSLIQNAGYDLKSGSHVLNYTLPQPNNLTQQAWVGTGSYNVTFSSQVMFDSQRLFGFQTLISGPYIYGESGADSVWNWTNPTAYQCELFACVRTYNSTMINGVLRETVLNTTEVPGVQSGDISESYELGVNKMLINGRYITCEAQKDNSTGLLPILVNNLNFTPDPSVVTTTNETETGLLGEQGWGGTVSYTWLPEECIWSISKMATLLSATELATKLNYQPIKILDGLPDASIQASRLWVNGTGNLESTNNFTASIADVMTANIRKRGARGLVDYESGTSFFETTCMEVEWQWLSFHAVLTFLTFAFFLIVVILQEFRNHETRIWKSSGLPLLYSTLDPTIQEQSDASQTRDQMMLLAHDSTAQMMSDEDGRLLFASPKKAE